MTAISQQPPAEPLYSHVQEVANTEQPNEWRRREIGYQINNHYPGRTTSQTQ
jgi:hypothetical protein